MRIALFSLIEWQFVNQRPQAFARELAALGHDIIYVEPSSYSEGVEAWVQRIGDGVVHIFPMEKNIRVCEGLLFPLRDPRHYAHNAQLKRPVAEWLSKLQIDYSIVLSPEYVDSLLLLGRPFSYDHVDETQFMDGIDTQAYVECMERLKTHGVFNIYIQEIAARQDPKGLFVPNGADGDTFFPVERAKIFDAVVLSTIAKWFDMDSILAAESRILLVGPMDHDQGRNKERFFAANKPNLHWIPQLDKPTANLWLASAEVGIVPFKLSHPVVPYAMPIKILEYFLAGLRVVTYRSDGIQDFYGDRVTYYGAQSADISLDEAIRAAKKQQTQRDFALPYNWKNIVGDLNLRILSAVPSGTHSSVATDLSSVERVIPQEIALTPVVGDDSTSSLRKQVARLEEQLRSRTAWASSLHEECEKRLTWARELEHQLRTRAEWEQQCFEGPSGGEQHAPCPEPAYFESRLRESPWFRIFDRMLLLLHPVVLNRDQVLSRMVKRRQQSWMTRKVQLEPQESKLTREAQYSCWVTQNYPTQEILKGMAGSASRFQQIPKFSILMPVHQCNPGALRAAIQSVRTQAYDNWELLLVDDASNDSQIQGIMAEFSQVDARVRFQALPSRRGVCAASNTALDAARGEFVARLGQEDELWPNALYECAKLLNQKPDVDYIYSDEDKITQSGMHFAPTFKPDWSPDLLLSMMYTSNLSVYRRSLIEEVGGFRPDYRDSHEYDLALRVSERTSRIAHIPTVLYSRRAAAAQEASDDVRPWPDDARQALQDALKRRQVDGAVEPGQSPGQWRVRYAMHDSPLVSIVVPSGGNLQGLESCLRSLLRSTGYQRFEIVVVDNSDAPHEVQALIAALGAGPDRARSVRFELRPFSYSAVVNHGVKHTRGSYLVLMSEDVTVEKPHWLQALLEQAQRPQVGVVGAKLLDPDGRLYHAGVVLGMGGIAGHPFKKLEQTDAVPMGVINATRNVSAVSFACAMMRRSVFQELQGLDERNLARSFGDVDFCLRARRAGYTVLYEPYAELCHRESGDNKWLPTITGETTFMMENWREWIERDPFYNPHLSVQHEDWSLRLADANHLNGMALAASERE